LEVLEKTAQALENSKNQKNWALLASSQYTNEEIYLKKKIFMDFLKKCQ